MPDRRQESNAALRDSLARTKRGVAAAAQRWLSASGASFAHVGHHIPLLSQLRRGETRSAARHDSCASAPAAQQTPSQSSPEQGRRSAPGSLSSCGCSQRGLGEVEAADSAGQPGAARQGRKKRRRASASFACASAGAEDGLPQGEWRWPQLPKWKPPRMPHFGAPLWVVLSPPHCPDKKQLIDVKDFFKYTEEAGREFFGRLDQDGDNKVTVEDVKSVMRQRKLPESYAMQFISAARGNRWWSNSISWDDFQAYVDEREPKMLRAFTSLEVNPAGQYDLKHIKSTLTKLGLGASDKNANAMIKALGAEQDGFVTYGKFRNFLILLPEAKLREADPSIAWYEAATMVPFGPPVQKGRTKKLLAQAALAGGIASGSTTLMMYPLDTLKTRVQSAAGASVASIVRSVPSIGLRGLYRGVLPAVSGQFVSHGLRTFAFEGSLTGLKALSGGAAELQMQALASGFGTVLGTVVRIPCEVLKQRLQVGRHANALQALSVARRTDGARGLFRGTIPLLSREVPFYVVGMTGYAYLKKVFDGSAFGAPARDLKDWQVIAIGGLAGALASIATTPADVLKTRMMTSAATEAVSLGPLLKDILRKEGARALFKGGLVRAVWTAPQGAMNFAGYELAKNALKNRETAAQASQLEDASVNGFEKQGDAAVAELPGAKG
ncbi:hypothetical protein CVIRNUC_007911 [Coccomyxa viridis]|uniref:EF-hand domain-containing protein n=1 Tax=Coccomyxa viridis TaxID=1274662 RepID=A0AAV1IEW2_9CHLO|nr:hypothetical protein CVIRNUC_007911 [Coccomyxa viridis]